MRLLNATIMWYIVTANQDESSNWKVLSKNVEFKT